MQKNYNLLGSNNLVSLRVVAISFILFLTTAFVQTDPPKPQKGGSVKNPDPVTKETDQGFLTKKATKTDVPGEYWIDLKVQGRQTERDEPADVVLMVDKSWSMCHPRYLEEDENGVKRTRWHYAKEAINEILKTLIPNNNSNFNIGMVLFNSKSEFNSKFRKDFTKDKDALINWLGPDYGYKRDEAGTNIQGGLLNSYDMLKNSTSNKKFIIVIGDGMPDHFYQPKNLVETPTKLKGYGGVNTGSLGTSNTKPPYYAFNEVNFNKPIYLRSAILPKYIDIEDATSPPNKVRILTNEYPVESVLYVLKKVQPDVKTLSVGVALSKIDFTGVFGRKVLKNIIDNPDKDYYETPKATGLPNLLKKVAKRLASTINNGTVTDPMSDQVSLISKNGTFGADDYTLTASKPELLNGVTVEESNGTISLKGLNLSKDQWVNIRYKVKLKDEFRTGKSFETNKRTTLDYDGNDPNNPLLDFNIPQVELFEGKVRLTKTFGGKAPQNGEVATFQLYEKVGNVDDATNGETDDKLIGNQYTTNNKGKLEVTKLFVGHYYFKEISTADKYKLVKDAIEFSVTGGSRDWQELATVDNPLKIVPKPAIKLEKTTDKSAEYKLVKGETITYSFKVTNTGNVTLTEVTLTDAMFGGAITLDKTTLAPNENTTVTKKYTITQDDVDKGKVVNTAKAQGTSLKLDGTPNKPIEDTDTVTVLGEQNPSIEIIKTADKTNLVVGETITYTFKVTNTGNVTLKKVKVTDQLPRLSAISPAEVTNLAPGDSKTFTATYKVEQTDVDNGEVKNQATATGNDPNDNPVTDISDNNTPGTDEDGKDKDNNGNGKDDDPTIVKGTQNPSIEIIKTADKTNLIVGETITYTFKVTNTGNVTLKKVKVTDPMFGGGITLGKTTLAPNDFTTGTKTYTITQIDVDNGEVVNTATAIGTPPNKSDGTQSDPITNDDTATVLGEQNPSIELKKLTKTLPENFRAFAGATITYVFEVKNTGNVTMKDINISDSKLFGNNNKQPLTAFINLKEITTGKWDSVKGELQPEGVITFEKVYALTQPDVDAGKVVNTAVVKGTSPKGVKKTDVSNSGNQGDEDGGERQQKGGHPLGNDRDNTNNPTVTLFDTIANLELEKTSEKEGKKCKFEIGQELVYIFKVTNTGDVTLYDVSIKDKMLEDANVSVTPEKIDLLSPKQTTIFKATYTVTQKDIDAGKIVNKATVKGNRNKEKPLASVESPEAEDKLCICGNDPAIKLNKVADKTELIEGEIITYTFTVKNIGKVTLTDVKIDDKLEGLYDMSPTSVPVLLPGEVTTFTAKYKVTQDDIDKGEVKNQALAIGTPPANEDGTPVEPVTDKSDNKTPGSEGNEGEEPTIVKAVQDPKIQLDKTFTKTGEQNAIAVGDVITYRFKVENIGNVTVRDIKIGDELEGLSAVKLVEGKTTLKPREFAIFEANYTITQEDVDNGKVINSAIAKGLDPKDRTVEDISDNNTPNKDEDNKDLDGNGNGNDDDPTVVPANPNQKPEIELLKGADKTVVIEGDIVTYTFKVTNTEKITVYDLKIEDNLNGLSNIIPAVYPSLAPGASTTFTATYKVTAEDVTRGYIINTATALANNPQEKGSDKYSVTDISDSVNKGENGEDVDNDGSSNQIKAGHKLGKNGNKTDDPTFIKVKKVIVANDDEFGSEGGNVLGNDTLNRKPATKDNTDVTPKTEGYLSIDKDGNVTVAPDTPNGTYQITYELCEEGEIPSNCTTAVATVVVKNPIKIFNEFSPNGDGVNDYFRINNIVTYPNNTLEIFNRWGNTVWKAKGYDNAKVRFEGISNRGSRAVIYESDKLPVGTYYYMLDLKDGSQVKKGWLYINR